MDYIKGSTKYDNSNNIISISFYHRLLENSIPYNYDIKGSYQYKLYKNNDDEIKFNEGDWIIDNESGILTFYSYISNVDKYNSPKITFYKYNGNKGLYPITFNKNSLVNIESNLNISDNLIVKKNINIESNLNLKNISFEEYNTLPLINNNDNKLVVANNHLYFHYNNNWNNISQNNASLTYEQFVYNVLDESLNKINIETRLTIIEVSQSLTQDIKIELPLIAKNGNEFTIIMGQSISQYIGDYHVILTGKFLSIDGIGPGDGEIKFKTTGQAVKLMSVLSEKSHIFGYENNYYQILYNHGHLFLFPQK